MCRYSRFYKFLFSAMFAAANILSVAGQDRNDPYTPSPVSLRSAVAINRPKEFVSPRAEGDRSAGLAATQTYRIGVGDVLYINIVNSSNGRGFYAVRSDGTIDYALAGERIVAEGQTPQSLERLLASSITLYKDPSVQVKVREYASHRVVLTGLVSNGGVRYLQREALPLFVICADADVNPKATRVAIRDARTNTVNIYDLRDPNTSNVLVNPGDEVDFLGS